MRTLQQMIGLPVLLATGKQVGRVLDVGFDEHWQMACIVLDSKVWFRKAVRIVKWEDVTVNGEDAIMISAAEAITTIHHRELQRTFHTGLIQLKELSVYSVEGHELGRVSDVYFRKTAGTQIAGYELSDGFLADVLEGRRKIYLPDGPQGVTLGEDAILVPVSYERILEREPNAESDR